MFYGGLYIRQQLARWKFDLRVTIVVVDQAIKNTHKSSRAEFDQDTHFLYDHMIADDPVEAFSTIDL